MKKKKQNNTALSEYIVDTGPSIKIDGVKLDLWAQTSMCNKLNKIEHNTFKLEV